MFQIETDKREIKPDSIVLLKGFEEIMFDFRSTHIEYSKAYEEELSMINAYLEKIAGREAVVDEIFNHIDRELQRFTIKHEEGEPKLMFEVGSIKQIIKP